MTDAVVKRFQSRQQCRFDFFAGWGRNSTLEMREWKSQNMSLQWVFQSVPSSLQQCKWPEAGPSTAPAHEGKNLVTDHRAWAAHMRETGVSFPGHSAPLWPGHTEAEHRSTTSLHLGSFLDHSAHWRGRGREKHQQAVFQTPIICFNSGRADFIDLGKILPSLQSS